MNRNNFLISSLKIEESTTRLEEDLEYIHDLEVFEGETSLGYEVWVKQKLHNLLGGYTFAEDVESIERMNGRILARFGEVDSELRKKGMTLVAEGLDSEIAAWEEVGNEIRRIAGEIK